MTFRAAMIAFALITISASVLATTEASQDQMQPGAAAGTAAVVPSQKNAAHPPAKSVAESDEDCE
jgi:hypothetical protein